MPYNRFTGIRDDGAYGFADDQGREVWVPPSADAEIHRRRVSDEPDMRIADTEMEVDSRFPDRGTGEPLIRQEPPPSLKGQFSGRSTIEQGVEDAGYGGGKLTGEWGGGPPPPPPPTLGDVARKGYGNLVGEGRDPVRRTNQAPFEDRADRAFRGARPSTNSHPGTNPFHPIYGGQDTVRGQPEAPKKAPPPKKKAPPTPGRGDGPSRVAGNEDTEPILDKEPDEGGELEPDQKERSASLLYNDKAEPVGIMHKGQFRPLTAANDRSTADQNMSVGPERRPEPSESRADVSTSTVDPVAALYRAQHPDAPSAAPIQRRQVGSHRQSSGDVRSFDYRPEAPREPAPPEPKTPAQLEPTPQQPAQGGINPATGQPWRTLAIAHNAKVIDQLSKMRPTAGKTIPAHDQRVRFDIEKPMPIDPRLTDRLERTKREYGESQAWREREEQRHAGERAALAENVAGGHDKIIDDLRTKGREEADKLNTEYRAAANDIDNTKIDPNHWWESKDTGGKVMAVIGSLLAGWYGGRAGDTQAGTRLLNQAIDRDIDAQKHNLANKRGKLTAIGKMYDEALRRTGDAVSAQMMAKSAALQRVNLHMDAVANASGSPIAMARAQEAIEKNEFEIAQLNFQVAERLGGKITEQHMHQKATTVGGFNPWTEIERRLKQNVELEAGGANVERTSAESAKARAEASASSGGEKVVWNGQTYTIDPAVKSAEAAQLRGLLASGKSINAGLDQLDKDLAGVTDRAQRKVGLNRPADMTMSSIMSDLNQLRKMGVINEHEAKRYESELGAINAGPEVHSRVRAEINSKVSAHLEQVQAKEKR